MELSYFYDAHGYAKSQNECPDENENHRNQCASFWCGILFRPESGDFQPATTNVLDASYPRVDGSSRVQLRIKAPDATKVRVNFWSGPKDDMERQADGFWTFTTQPLAPGLHYYTIDIDGAEVSDSGSHTFFGGSKDASAVEVPEKGVTYYLPEDVPHGQVRDIWYHSSETGTWRHAFSRPNIVDQMSGLKTIVRA